MCELCGSAECPLIRALDRIDARLYVLAHLGILDYVEKDLKKQKLSQDSIEYQAKEAQITRLKARLDNQLLDV